MSVIACKRNGSGWLIASDTQTTYSEDLKIDCGSKIDKIGDAFFFGFAGPSIGDYFKSVCKRGFDIGYLDNAGKDDLVLVAESFLKTLREIFSIGESNGYEYQVLIINKAGAFEISGLSVTQIKEYHAIGSGMGYALAALDCGVGLTTAIEIAKSRDPYCGGEAVIVEVPGVAGEDKVKQGDVER